MSEIEFKTKVSYHQFLNVDDTVEFLKNNGLKISVTEYLNETDVIGIYDKGIEYWSTRLDKSDSMPVYKNDYIFIVTLQNIFSIFDQIATIHYFVKNDLESLEIIKHLEENQVIEVK